MASKNKTKGLGTDPSLGKMGHRMIHTMLREERVAERDLQEKLKAISEKEHKTMVKLGCNSLDIRHDLTLHQASSSLSSLDISTEGTDENSRPKLGRKTMSMVKLDGKQECSLQDTDLKRSFSEENHNNRSPTIIIDKHEETLYSICVEEEGKLLRSPRLLQRRPISDISTYSASQAPSLNNDKDNSVFIQKISIGKRTINDVYQKPKAPSTPPPVRRNLNPLPSDSRLQRPSSARLSRSKSPNRGIEPQRLDISLKHKRSPSPSPVRLSADGSVNLTRRGSAPPKIDANMLPINSPLRRALCSSDVCLNPSSPEALRKRLSQTDEDLQDRVSVFLKTLSKK